MASHYEILGCDKNAPYEELKRRYLEEAKKHHPDKSREESRRFILLDKAWKTLRDPDARREYDLSLAKNEMEDMPVYCEVHLSELEHRPEADTYVYACRCGGEYVLEGRDSLGCDSLKVPCPECTFHIVVRASK